MNDGKNLEKSLYNLLVYNAAYNNDDSQVNYPYTVELVDPEEPVKFEFTSDSHGADPVFNIKHDANGNFSGLEVNVTANNGTSDTAKCSIGIIVKYTIAPDKVKKVERTIHFDINRTLAFASSLSAINANTFNNDEPSCLLMDNNYNYYKLDKDGNVLRELIDTENLFNIAGIVYYNRANVNSDGAKGIAIPLQSINDFLDTQFNYFWPNDWHASMPIKQNYYDNVFANHYALFDPKSSGYGNAIQTMLKGNMGDPSNYSCLSKIGSGTEWVSGQCLTEALCEDNWRSHRDSGGYNPLYKGYAFTDVHKAAELIESGTLRSQLLLPNLYLFFDKYCKNIFGNFGLANENMDNTNLKCYIGTIHEYRLLAQGLPDICKFIDDYILNIVNYAGVTLLDSNDLIVSSINRIKQTGENLMFFTHSVSDGAMAPGATIDFAMVSSSYSSADDIFAFTPDLESAQTLVRYNNNEQGKRVMAIPFIKLK
jgi:hypothetical protein